ncbi:MAG TPA: hypothetical protein PKW35_01690, partial [Nannocystaceae bacterium]|nr:hypothetical protein [Nannocystaceae bacterium]
MPHPDTTGELLGPLLEATSIGELLTAYQALPRPIALSEVAQHVGSNHPRLRLLAWRIEAGPPGVELPAPEVATARLADPRSVRPEDVGALVLIPHALPVDPSALADVLTSWLDAAPTSLPHMTAAIAVSALLACILAGAAERADGLISALRRRELPQTSESVTFDALASGYQRVREHASSPTLRVVAAILWRALALPSLPDLVAHIDFEHVDRRTLVAIAKSGAGQPNSLLANAADHLLRHETANQLDDHPLVRDLRRLARENMSIADLHARALDLPPGLVHWATLRIRSDDAGPARLAAWALYGQGRLSAAGLALLLMGRPHAEDLDFIAKHSPTEEARATASRLVQDLGDSPPDVAAALVRFIFGRWDDDSIAILREKLAPLVHAGDRIHGEALDAARRFLDLDARMAHEAEAATAGVERFLEQVASIRAYFSPTESDAALIDRLLARLDEPYLEPAFFDVVLAKAESLGQPDRLLACLAAHRWAHSNARLRTYAPALAEMVTRDIERLGALHLFPDRVHLLTEVIAACAESERAEYICRRGCTHATLASSDPRHAGPAEADFEQAAALARRHHLVEIEIWALTSHLRLLQTPNAHFNARSVNLVERLRELECLTQDPTALADIRTVVADRLLGQTSPDDIEGARLAIEHLRTVVRDTDAATVLGQQARERLAQELVNYGTPAERREALALARATFENRLHPDSEELSAPAHFTLASAFLATPENSDSAKEHLDAALRGYSRAGNRSGIQATRHLLAEFYASRDELAAGRTHADIAFQLATEHGDHGAILAATVSLLRLAPAGPHDPRIARAVSILPSGHKVRLRVHQALALAEAGASIDPCVADLLEFWSASSPRTDAATLAAAITLAHNHPDRLAGPLLDAALRWSERIDHPTLRARLLIHTGRTEEACSLLRSVTTDAETGQLRTSAALLLLAALPSDRADERARLCDDIEPRLDFNAASEAAALFDLAQGLLQTSEHDPGRLQRAWAAAEAAAKHLPANLHATSLRQRWTIRAQQIIAEVKESSERTAELAEWLVLAQRPSGSVDEHIPSAAFPPLLFGRLTHP